MTNGIVVNIQGEDINKMIAQAILDSTLGDEVREAVGKIVNEIGKTPYSGDSQVQRAVRDVVYKAIRELVEAEYGDVIRERVRAEIEKQLAPEGDLVARLIGNMLSGHYRD